jgi:NAD(P)-dependent dehydrogenase (short-subunit alcohol dehydrogenase family)
MDFQSKTAIVTGGTGALGRAVAERLFEDGANVVIPYMNPRSLDSLPEKMRTTSDRTLLIRTDLTREDQVASLFGRVMGTFGTVHFLANVAGGFSGGRTLADVTTGEWDAMFDINLRTAFLMCRGVLGVMRGQNFGRIVNIAAMPALGTGAGKGPYAISKRGVVALTETIAEEVKGTGITVNAVAPSIILTEANKRSMPQGDFAKWVTVEEIAQLILYLFSDDARSISGNTIRIYGGV